MFLLFGLMIGAMLAIQTGVNSRLRQQLGSPFLSSMISFLVGSLFLSLLVSLQSQPLADFSQHWQQQPFWLWIGGGLGVIALTTNILLFPYLGAVQTTILPILGQIIMGILIDQFGLFDTSQIPFGIWRALGISLVLVGMGLAIFSKKEQRKSVPYLNLWRLLGISAGALAASQTAINGKLGIILNSPLQASLISFWVGASILMLFVLLFQQQHLNFKKVNFSNSPVWMWFGGVLGAVFVFGGSYLMPRVGTGQTVILALTGQIIGSLLMDYFGLLGNPKQKVQLIKLVGIALLITGVVCIKI